MKYYTSKELKNIVSCCRIENNMVESVDVNIIAHYGNICCLEVYCKDVILINSYNNIGNIGYILREFIELLDIAREDGLRITDIKNVPVRLVYESCTDKTMWGAKCIGFGNFMKDKFVLIKDLMKVKE